MSEIPKSREAAADGPDGAPAGPVIFESAKQGATEFTGREWVLKQIVDWMDHGSERVLLLIAEPGWGKSSLCAWMIAGGRPPQTDDGKALRARLEGAWSAAYLCSATGGSTTNPTTFSRSIAAQLVSRFDDFATAFLRRAAPGQFSVAITARDIIGRAIGILTKQIVVNALDARDVYEQSIRLPLVDIAAASHDSTPIFILVDGLDDALTFRSPNIVDLLSASTDFPDRVRFFLTSRREDRVVNAFKAVKGVRFVAVSDEPNKAANDADIGEYIEWRAAEPSIELWVRNTGLDREAFVKQLVAHAAGNFLFIRFVLDNPPSDSELQASVPTGLQVAYDSFLARVLPSANAYGPNSTWTETVKPVLGALAVAVPAAPEDTLPRWLGPTGHVDDALQTVGQLTEWVADEGGRGSRRLYHRSLGDFLSTDELPKVAGVPQRNRFFVEPRKRHESIIAYYLTAVTAEWDNDWRKCDRYGLRQLVPHLYALHALTVGNKERAQVAEQICDLALDAGFQAAQREVLGDGSATIEAIRLALEVCVETRDADSIRKRVHRVAESWEPEMRASAARAIAELHRMSPKAALDELKALLV